MKRMCVIFVVHTEGELESHQYSVPLWAFEVGKWTAGGIAVLVVLFFLFAGPITRNAVRAQLLDRRVARLRVANSATQEIPSPTAQGAAKYTEIAGEPGGEGQSPKRVISVDDGVAAGDSAQELAT